VSELDYLTITDMRSDFQVLVTQSLHWGSGSICICIADLIKVSKGRYNLLEFGCGLRSMAQYKF
jgi:hypothetical protein